MTEHRDNLKGGTMFSMIFVWNNIMEHYVYECDVSKGGILYPVSPPSLSVTHACGLLSQVTRKSIINYELIITLLYCFSMNESMQDGRGCGSAIESCLVFSVY